MTKQTTAPHPVNIGGPGTCRLHRTDPRNIALQRLTPGGHWLTIAYCGNNARAIVRVVGEMATAEWTPDAGGDLSAQLAALGREIRHHETAVTRLAEQMISNAN